MRQIHLSRSRTALLGAVLGLCAALSAGAVAARGPSSGPYAPSRWIPVTRHMPVAAHSAAVHSSPQAPPRHDGSHAHTHPVPPRVPAGAFVPDRSPSPPIRVAPAPRTGSGAWTSASGISLEKSVRVGAEGHGGAASAFAPASAAAGGGILIQAGERYSALSPDSGAGFRYIDPAVSFPELHGGFCCAPTVAYVPHADTFVWLLTYRAGAANENALRLAYAPAADALAGTWRFVDFHSGQDLNLPGRQLLAADLVVGTGSLYLTADILENGGLAGSVAIRIPLAGLAAGSVAYTSFRSDRAGLRAAANCGTRAFFAAHDSTSQVRTYAWDEGAAAVSVVDVLIPTWSPVEAAAGAEWLGQAAGGRIQSAARAGGELWLAWTAGGGGANRRPHPHVRVVRIAAGSRGLVRSLDLFSGAGAMAYPVLAAGAGGEVGISLAVEGGDGQPSHAVGFLTGSPALAAVNLSSGAGGARPPAGGFTSIRPHGARFLAAGIHPGLPGAAAEPRCILFSRSAGRTASSSTFRLGDASAGPGQDAALPLQFTASGAQVAGAQFDLVFDSTRVSFVSAANGTLPPNVNVTATPTGAGRVQILIFGLTNLTPFGTGTLATITMRPAAGAAPGSTIPVQLALPGTTTDGVRVSDPQGTGSNAAATGSTITVPGGQTFSISGRVTQNGAGLSGVSVSTGASQATTDGGGNYTIAGLAAGSHTVTPSRSGFTFTPASRQVTITNANLTGQDFTAAPAAAAFRLLNGSVAAGGTAALNLQYTQSGQVTVAVFDLLYDAAKLTFVSAARGALPAGVDVTTEARGSGRTRVVIFGAQNRTPFASGVLAALTFRGAAGVPRGTQTPVDVVLPDTANSGVDVSDPDGLPSVASAAGATVTFGMRGDLDGDGRITVADIQQLLNVILGRSAPDLRVHDLNGDGSINAADLQIEVNLFLGIAAGRPSAAAAARDPGSQARRARSKTFRISFNSGAARITAIGFDVDLAGGTLDGVSLRLNRSDLQLATSTLENGRARILLFSSTGTPIPSLRNLFSIRATGPRQLRPLQPGTSTPGAEGSDPDGNLVEIPYARRGGRRGPGIG